MSGILVFGNNSDDLSEDMATRENDRKSYGERKKYDATCYHDHITSPYVHDLSEVNL